MNDIYVLPMIVAATAALLAGCGEVSAGNSSVQIASSSELATEPTVEVCNGLFADYESQINVDQSLCIGCEVDNPRNSIDGSYDSVTSVYFSGPVGTIRLSARAPDGVVFPPAFAGSFLGSVIWPTSGSVQGQISLSVQIFRNGIPVASSAPTNEGPSVGVNWREKFSFRGVQVAEDFDQVDLTFQWRANVEPGLLRVSEFCASSDSAAGAFTRPARTASAATAGAPGDDGLYVVDLLVLYTPRYLLSVGNEGSVREKVQKLIDHANSLFESSLAPIRYRLVGLTKYTKISETLPTSQAHNVLEADPKVKHFRDSIGADLTVVVATRDLGADLCGRAELFNNGTQSEVANDVDADLDSFAIVHVGDGQFETGCNDSVFAHELGHLLGGGHEATGENAAIGVYWKPYAHAWACGKNGEGISQVTVMHSDGKAVEHSEFFSSPQLTSGSEACGQEGVSGDEATQADNVRAMSEAVPYVSNYR